MQVLKITKEIKVAIFAIVAGTLLYTGFNFLKGIDLFRTTSRYYSKYANVAGLQVSNAVILNGLNVGRVSEIKILDDEKHSLQVAFDIDKTIVLGDSAKAVIASPDLLGGKAIILVAGSPKNPIKENSFITGEVEQGITSKLTETAAPIVNSVQNTMGQVNKLMSDENIKSISQSLHNLEKTTRTLNKVMEANKANLASITSNLKKLSASLVETEKEIKPLLQKANVMADSVNKMQLAATVANINKTVGELNIALDGINKGQGSIGQFMKNDSLYIYLNNTSRDLDKLLVDFKANPKRYVHFSVFGGKK